MISTRTRPDTTNSRYTTQHKQQQERTRDMRAHASAIPCRHTQRYSHRHCVVSPPAQKNRLQLRRTVPIPQAIIDQYDRTDTHTKQAENAPLIRRARLRYCIFTHHRFLFFLLLCTDLECKSFVGLFPEIHRAFITIDNKLFLWNYYDGSDFYVYDELSQIIISVALLRPKPGVFVSSIQYILVLSTPVEILMFAVKFDGDNVHNSLQLFPTQFTVPSDNVHMTSIIGTEQGRIFLCGRDGGIYELDYWSGDEGSWFGGAGSSSSSSSLSLPFSNLFTSNRKKCRKLNHSSTSFKLLRSILPGFLGGNLVSGSGPSNNVSTEPHVESIAYDPTRNFLYTLINDLGRNGASRPVVAVYELGSDGLGMRLRARLEDVVESTRIALTQLTSDMYSDLPNELKLVHLSTIPVHESPTIILMAITSHGHRLYFSLERNGKLRVKFVRLCPPAITPEELHRGVSTTSVGSGSGIGIGRSSKVEPRFAKGTSPSLVHSAYYKDGILLLADAGRSALGDSLVSIHKDPRPPGSTTLNLQSWQSSSSSSSNLPASLNETIDSFDFESRIADVGEVHQASSMSLLANSLFARPTTSSSSSSFTSKYEPITSSGSNMNGLGQRTFMKPLYGLPELATQHLTPNRQLLILTSNSLLTMTKIRPLDELRHALSVKKRTNDEGSLNTFLQRYGSKEACAMCLILIGASYSSASSTSTTSSSLIGEDDVERRSTNGLTLQLQSPNKLLASPSTTQTGGISDDQLRKSAKQAFFRFGETTITPTHSNFQDRSTSNKALQSPKLEAVALYMSRWIRAHWDWSLCLMQPDTNGGSSLQFRFTREFYADLLQPLLKLQRFLDDNQRLLFKDFSGPSSSSSSGVPIGGSSMYGGGGVGGGIGSSSSSASGLADPSRLESQNFQALMALLNLIIEVLQLLVLFLAAPPSPSASMYGGVRSELDGASYLLRSSPFLNSSDLQSLKDMKFYDLITNPDGHSLIRKLINTLAYVGGGSNAGTAGVLGRQSSSESDYNMSGRLKRSRRDDTDDASNQLIAQLHSACPTFFGSSDLLYYNALDSLKHAKQNWNLATERHAHIQRALATYHSFLSSSTFPLEDVADKLKSVYEYSGIVELAMRRAELLERREVSRPKLNGMTNGTIQHQTEQEYYVHQRKRCFNVILDTMNILMFGVVAGKSLTGSSSSSTSPASPSSSNTSGNASDRTSTVGGVGSTTLTIDSTIPPQSSEQIAACRDRVIQQILSSNDAALHESLYSWYIEVDLLDDLYTIQSDYLIRFLTSSETYVLILKDYYLRNERWHEASLLLNYLSLKRSNEYNLRLRTDYLTQSLNCARNFQQQLEKNDPSSLSASRNTVGLSKRIGGTGIVGGGSIQTSIAEQQDLIDQLKDRIEIAKIQTEIYGKLDLMLKEVRDTTINNKQQHTEWRGHLSTHPQVRSSNRFRF